jgi:beta-lactamase class A
MASDVSNKLAALEKASGGRLGVAVLDTQTGMTMTHRADERFGFCSTFKFLAAAAVLRRVDKGLEQLDRQVPYSKADIIDYAPVTEQHVDEGSMSLSALCAAAVELSDNTAGNLILRTLGGPAGLTQFMRDIGDEVSRLDRTEPTLNLITPGDPRDTTTPAAMLKMMKTLLVDDALSPTSRQQLQDWMRGCKTGAKRIAAGLPQDWQIGDKTGTGPNGEANDVAIVWPSGRGPILIASYYVGTHNTPDERNGVHAAVGRLAVSSI